MKKAIIVLFLIAFLLLMVKCSVVSNNDVRPCGGRQPNGIMFECDNVLSTQTGDNAGM